MEHEDNSKTTDLEECVHAIRPLENGILVFAGKFAKSKRSDIPELMIEFSNEIGQKFYDQLYMSLWVTGVMYHEWKEERNDPVPIFGKRTDRYDESLRLLYYGLLPYQSELKKFMEDVSEVGPIECFYKFQMELDQKTNKRLGALLWMIGVNYYLKAFNPFNHGLETGIQNSY